MTYILGVDGGNTKTIALLARQDGTILGAGRGGCGDIYADAGPDGAIAEIERAVLTALASGGAQAADLEFGAYSLAGADWPEDFALFEREMRRLGFGRTIKVVNDALGALWAGAPDGAGVSVVCGTGIAIGARGLDGRIWHGSFWLEPLGANELGHRLLRAVLRAELAIDPPTALTARVLEFYGCEHLEQVLHACTARGATPPNVGRLARVLLDEAARGDPTARRIAIEHGQALGDYALVAARQVGIERVPFTLVLAGGVLRHPGRLLAETLAARVRDVAPDVHVIDSRFEPAVGALFLALESAGVAIDAPLLARLTPTLPSAAFFAT
ncbi:MAG TPA: BadF/BadG/BcrA/BcrD ATPase family protein [Roseiflexaceae bacterium]|nr:BadF/BadG/BcrA/BcrD ATPase family protein [Roseiflexaceae bacterium]